MRKHEIVQLLKKENIYQWEIAKKIGIHETSLSRWFRDELTTQQSQQILSAIEEIKLDRLNK